MILIVNIGHTWITSKFQLVKYYQIPFRVIAHNSFQPLSLLLVFL